MYTVDKYRSTFFRTTSSTLQTIDCRNAEKAAPVKPKGFANIQKVPLHLIFFCFITVMRFCASAAAKKTKQNKKGNITVDREAQHLNIVMCLRVSGR